MPHGWRIVVRWLSKAGFYMSLAALGLIAFVGLFTTSPWYVTLLLYFTAIGSFSVHFVTNWNNRS
jgi:Na+/melibiose symporter-like transporter